MNDLWADQRQQRRDEAAPLAVRMRPRSLEELLGQQRVVGPGSLLARALDADRLTSLIVHGPPGTGKTALAAVIAGCTGCHFERANATVVGVRDVRTILEGAARRLEDGGRRTILFLDEVHRFSRNQQDVLLDDVENGVVILIGATTENPWFAVNSALVSRSTILRFEPLSEDDVRTLVRRAITDERGFGHLDVAVDDDAIDHWAVMCDGDARRALNALEVAVLSSRHPGDDGPIAVDLACAEASIQVKAIVHDRTGDGHYDLISALIKSMRAGDAEGSMGWLARMLEAGEDPRFIARRVAIFASEDVGPADPTALPLADAAWSVTERVGLPECRYVLAQAVLHMAQAPKSRAATEAILAAEQAIRTTRTVPVPPELR